MGGSSGDGSERRFSLFFDILTRHDLPDYRRLAGLIQRHALAGVTFAAWPWGLWNDPILTEPGVPRVVIADSPHGADIPAVSTDGAALLPRACEWLAGRGRRRVAVLSLAGLGSSPRATEQEPGGRPMWWPVCCTGRRTTVQMRW